MRLTIFTTKFEGTLVRISLKFQPFSVFVAVAALSAALVAGPVAAQNTTSSIRVVVTGQGGAPVGGVTVAVTHIPTERTQTISSNNQGIATLRGIAVGGPYEVRTFFISSRER